MRRHLIAYAGALAAFISAIPDPETQEKLLRQYLSLAVKHRLLTKTEADFVERIVKCAIRKARLYEDYYEAAIACARD